MAEYMDIARIDDWNDLSIIDDNGNATYVYDVGELPRADVIEIPEGATNGDMIKALFPNAEFRNAMPFTDGRWEVMNLDTENRMRAIYRPTVLRTYADWWNAPYRKVEE